MSAEEFKKNKYTILKNAISPELANFAFNYFLLKREAVEWMIKSNRYYSLG